MESTSEGSSMSTTGDLSRLQLFQIIKDILKDDIKVIYRRIEKFLSENQNATYYLSEDEKRQTSDLVCKIKTRWDSSNRTEEKFKKKNYDWLSKTVELKKGDKKKTRNINSEQEDIEKNCKVGRRELSFSESSERTKRRKTEDLRANVSTEELLYSTTSKLRSEGKTDFAIVVRDISEGSPTKAKKYRKSLESANSNLPFTNDEALSLFIELGLSQGKYQQLRNAHLQKKIENAAIL